MTSPHEPPTPAERRIFANRTLNLRAIKAVGYDMDYTLVHYRIAEWERAAFEHLVRGLAEADIPTEGLSFDETFAIRGLVIDSERGNVVKTNRFGFVKRAMHGTRLLPFEELRATYARTIVDLSDPRWEFLNTFFSISEASAYCQLVDRLDAGAPFARAMGYSDLYKLVRKTLDRAHMEGALKGEVMRDPARFVELDPGTAEALLDQRAAGKKVLLITNSEWAFTDAMMRFAIEPSLPAGMRWRELFDVVVTSARKPEFFKGRAVLFEVLPEARLEGAPQPTGAVGGELYRPAPRGIEAGRVYSGGTAADVERFLGLSGDDVLYVGDHVYGDVHVPSLLGWRTALIVRELEADIRAAAESADVEAELSQLMTEKEILEEQACRLRLAILREKQAASPAHEPLHARLAETRAALEALDPRIAPLAKQASEASNPTWGLLLRTGNDKSHMARHIERHADVYTSRVSNFALATPYAFLRSRRLTLPHDTARSFPGPAEGVDRPAGASEAGSSEAGSSEA